MSTQKKAMVEAEEETLKTKRQEELHRLHIEFSEVSGQKWNIQRQIRTEKKLTAQKRRQKQDEKAQNGAEYDVETKEAQKDDGYLAQNTPAPAYEDGSDSDLSSAPDLSESDSESNLVVVSSEE